MALPSYLANIKSSGIYRFVWDKSEIPNAESNVPMRLVVGYSEKGPFNVPVYVRTQTEFRKIFGGISKKLERYGCFFHRLALQALRKSPILCLNMKNFDAETVEAVSFNIGDYLQDQKGSTAVSNIFNTSRFWTLEPEILEDDIVLKNSEEGQSDIHTSNEYITITATDSKESSNTIFVRGYEPAGYDVTFKEWYSSVLNGAEVPSYIEKFENNKLNRYWAEVYVFRGEFTPEIATSDVLAKYFDIDNGQVKLKPFIVNAFGEKKDTLDLLANNDASNFVRKYQGILLPEFVGANGSPISLDIVFNSDNDLHKMMMRLNQTLLYDETISLDDIDTMGWNAAEGITMDNNNISYAVDDSGNLSVSSCVPVIAESDYNQVLGQWLTGIVDNPTGNAPMDLDGMTVDFYAYNLNTAGATVAAVNGDNYTVKISGNDVNAGYGTNVFPYTTKIGEQDADAGTVKVSGLVVNNNERYVKVTIVTTEDTTGYWQGKSVYAKESEAIIGTPFKIYDENFNELDWEDNAATPYMITLTAPAENPNKDTVVNLMSQIGLSVSNTLWIDDKVCTITKMEVKDDGLYITFDKEVNAATNLLAGLIVKCVGSAIATSVNLTPTYIKGYDYTHLKPNSSSQVDKNDWINYQLSILDTKGIREALVNRTAVDFRYLIDTFESFAVGGECKAKLALICKLKDNAFGLLNFPAMKSFSKSPINFKGSDGILDTKYIAEGCNPMTPAAVPFSLASQDNGASYVSYNTPLIITDPETGVRTTIPAAALVSNDFMDKYTKFLPYSIVAGVKRGMITDPNLIGPDFSFGRYDLDNLEPMGVNCMVYVPGKGTYINSNQTAKQNPVTALSKIHIRELCIFLQDEIEKMMENYHWDFNTPNLRQTLKDRADVICDVCKNNQGIYEYYNQCDTQNNTPEIIDNEMVILSTSIEPSRGAGKMIQELTLYRTGGLSVAIQDA